MIYEAWRCAFTRRWHCNADLHDTFDPILGHSGRMALVGMMIWPGDDALLRACILHDVPEGITGDIPSPSIDHEMRDLKERREQDARSALQLPVMDRSARVTARLDFLDKLDAYLYAIHTRPRLQFREEWTSAFDRLWELATAAKCVDELSAIIDGQSQYLVDWHHL